MISKCTYFFAFCVFQLNKRLFFLYKFNHWGFFLKSLNISSRSRELSLVSWDKRLVTPLVITESASEKRQGCRQRFGSGISNIWMSVCIEALCLRGQTMCLLHYINFPRHWVTTRSPKIPLPGRQNRLHVSGMSAYTKQNTSVHKSIISQKWHANKEHTHLMNRQV